MASISRPRRIGCQAWSGRLAIRRRLRSNWSMRCCCLMFLVLIAGCSARVVPPADDPSGLFDDRTVASGLDFRYQNGEEAGHRAILETLGGGVALLDFDGDGLLDIFLPGGGSFDRTDADFQNDKSKIPGI